MSIGVSNKVIGNLNESPFCRVVEVKAGLQGRDEEMENFQSILL